MQQDVTSHEETSLNKNEAFVPKDAPVVSSNRSRKRSREHPENMVQQQQQPECPVIVLLNSHFFVASGLKIVNREAAQYTRILAGNMSKIARVWREHRCLQMYYNEDDFEEDQNYSLVLHCGPSTHEGPPMIREDSTDVFRVIVTMRAPYFLSREGNHAMDGSLEALADDIVDWWLKIGKHKINTFHDVRYLLPSGRLVDFVSHDETENYGFGRIYLCGPVIRGYLKYNSLWPTLATPLNKMRGICWLIMTAMEYETYGYPQHGDISVHVFRSQEECVEFNETSEDETSVEYVHDNGSDQEDDSST